jgi:pimeloyl-ACP methyl ester carboxylesterase
VTGIVAVPDAVLAGRPVVAGISASGWISLLTAALHPERVLGVVAFASWAPEIVPWPAHRCVHDFDEVPDTEVGWAKENRHLQHGQSQGEVHTLFACT